MSVSLGEWSGSAATRELHETIKQFNETSKKQTDQIVRLTKVIVWLTVAMLAAVLVQIYIAFRQI